MYWSGLTPTEARELLAQKDKSKQDKRMSVKSAVDKYVKDGYTIGLGGFVNSRQPVGIVHEIIRQGKKDLTISFHSTGLSVEYLAGAMALNPEHFTIKRAEFAYWGLELFGISPILRYLAEDGRIEIEDWSNFNMSARLKAAAMGIPFIPCRSPLGSDVLKTNRAKVMECPFTGNPVVLVPACHPHVAVLHVQEADIYGNCRVEGPTFTCPELAMAAGHTIVTCERIINHEEMTRDPNRINIPYFSVDAVVEVPYGAYPGNCHSHYYFDENHFREFRAAGEAFRKGNLEPLTEYYNRFIFQPDSHAGFMAQIPYNQIIQARQAELRDFQLTRCQDEADREV